MEIVDAVVADTDAAPFFVGWTRLERVETNPPNSQVRVVLGLLEYDDHH